MQPLHFCNTIVQTHHLGKISIFDCFQVVYKYSSAFASGFIDIKFPLTFGPQNTNLCQCSAGDLLVSTLKLNSEETLFRNVYSLY